MWIPSICCIANGSLHDPFAVMKCDGACLLIQPYWSFPYLIVSPGPAAFCYVLYCIVHDRPRCGLPCTALIRNTNAR